MPIRQKSPYQQLSQVEIENKRRFANSKVSHGKKKEFIMKFKGYQSSDEGCYVSGGLFSVKYSWLSAFMTALLGVFLAKLLHAV
jgi:hypothetical protein